MQVFKFISNEEMLISVMFFVRNADDTSMIECLKVPVKHIKDVSLICNLSSSGLFVQVY